MASCATTRCARSLPREIEPPAGSPNDRPCVQTVCGLRNRKNELVARIIREHRVQPYEASVRYVLAARDARLGRAIVSSSTNCPNVSGAVGVADLFEEVIDGPVEKERHLHGKRAPDTFLAGAWTLGVEPARAAVFEATRAGVETGRAGGFGCAVGVGRAGQAAALQGNGAGVVGSDLAELLERR